MLNSRKSFSSFSPSADRTKSPRRKTMDPRSLPSFDEAENNINSANKRRYSLRSPGHKKSSGISLYDESNNMSGNGNLLNLSDYVADRLDESCFSIHSEEGKTEASASKDAKKNSRRDTFEGTIDLNTSEMDASNASNFSFGATNVRRNTVDHNDMSALMRDLEDSEDDNQSQLQISMSTSASSVHGMNILDVTGESSEAPKKRRRSSISTLGHSEGAPESDFMFSPARSTRSRASKSNTPVPPSVQNSSSALRRSARSPARASKSPLGADLDEESVISTRKSPRSALKANKTSTPNFLDTTNSFSASKLNKSDTPDFLNQTNTLSGDASMQNDDARSEELHESRMHDLLGMDDEENEEENEEVLVDLRSAKKSSRRDTADFTYMADLLGDLDASQDASMSLDASRVSHTSSSNGHESVSSVNTMELNLKISEIMGETPTQIDTQMDSVPASPMSTLSHASNLSSLHLDEAHSQASTANMSDLSLLSGSSRSSKSKSNKKNKGSSSSAKKPSKTPQSAGAVEEQVQQVAEVSVQLNQSVATSAAASPAMFNRRETMDGNLLNLLDQSDLGAQSVASAASMPADRNRRSTMDPADLMNLLDSSDLQESAHKARRTTIDAADMMSLLDSSELQSPTQDNRRTTMDAANMSALLNFSTTSEVREETEEVEEKEVPDMLLDESASGFGSFAGRESIDMSVLQEMVANRLNEDSAVPSPAASVASSMSFSVFSSKQTDRRDTVDPSSIMGALEDETNHLETSVLALSTSNLSAHTQSFHKSPLKPSSSTSVPAGASTPAPLEEEVEMTEELSDDGRSDNGTINAADLDLLNDTMSTNQSFQTVATLDLQMLAEHQIEEIVRLSEDNSDAESEMTSDTIGTLAGFLNVSGMVEEDTQHVQGQEAVAMPQTAESPASVQSNASSSRSSRSDRFTRPKVPSSPAPKMPASPASSRSTGSRRSRSSYGSSDTPDSFDHTAELSVRSAVPRPLKTFGKKGRASLSTSVVIEAPLQRQSSVRRASVGPIATTAPAASPAKARKPAQSQVAPPSPAPTPRATDLSVSGLNDSSVQSVQVPASVLKSCLSSRKMPRPHMRFDGDSSLLGSSLKRNVVFGSPQACEFHKTSPTTNFTPLHKDHAKSLFSMEAAASELPEETTPDVETEENDEVMDQWERFTNASEGYSSDDEPIEEFNDEGMDCSSEADLRARGDSRSRRGSVGGGKRRDSKRMPSIALDADSSSEGSEMSLNASRESLQPVPYAGTAGTGSEPAEISISPESSFDVPYVIQMEPLDASVVDEDATGTVCLPGSLAELVAESMAATSAMPVVPVAVSEPVSNTNTSVVSDASRTEEIEVDLQALMRKMHTSHYRADATSAEHEQDDMQSIVSSYSDAGSQRMSILEAFELSGDLSMSMQAEEGQDALGALIGRHSDASTIATMQGELDTSVHSARSTRSTRSGASRASVASAASAVSVDSKASKGSNKGVKKGKKGESPAAPTPVVAQQELSMSMHSTASVLEISALEDEDNTYQLEGTLAAMVNTLAASPDVKAPHVETPLVEVMVADASVHSTASAVEMSMQEEEDDTYQLESSLAAMINTLVPTAAASPVTAWQGSQQEISVIEGAAQEDMECDFSALESPRPSGIAADSSVLHSADVDADVSGSSRVMRRSTASSRGSGASTRQSGSIFNLSHSDLTHETFGEFSLLASNEEEEENIRALAAPANTLAAAPSSIMSRLQNLNKGARSNSLLQAGTPVIRPEQSRMSIGFKRQSMAGVNLNSSVNMSVLQAPKSAVKSSKKARREVSLVVEEVSESILSPTPSMAKVYTEAASPTVQFSNPLRGAPRNKEVAKEVVSSVEERADENEDSMEQCEQSVEVSAEVSVLNETSTDYVPIVANLRAKLYSFFSAVQTIKTVLSTYSVDVRAIVQTVMESHIESAYVDSPLQHVPLQGLTHAWTLSAPEAEAYVQYVLDTYPQCYKQQRMSHPDQHHDQLWVNMCAKTIIDNTGALKRAQEAHDAAQAQGSGDRFYNKALNREHSARAGASQGSDFSALLTAQQAQAAAQVKRDLQETELMIDIVNKLTYCRVTTFTSSLVRISAILSPTVSAELAFQLQRTVDGAGQTVLTIQDVHVDLSVKQDNRTPKATQAQNLFVTAYFASVMCADELDGPLSQKSLLAAAEPSDIPDLLHKVSASIAELRWALLRHSTLSAGGFKCIVAKTTVEQGGFKCLVSVPTEPARRVLHVSVRDFVSACGVPQAAPMEGFVVREDNNEEVSPEEREELLSQLQVRLDSCLAR